MAFVNGTSKNNSVETTGFEQENEKAKIKKFSEIQKCDGEIVDSIVIDATSVSVNVHQWISSNITVKFEGEANVISGDVEFECYIIDRKLYITVNTKGIVVNQFLEFDVWLPTKAFNRLIVRTTYSDICIDRGVYARNIEVQTYSGNMKVCATFVSANLRSNDGDISVSFNAQSRTEVKISTISGNINIFPSNVHKLNLNAKSKYGEISNDYLETYGYIAMINASSKSGNIVVS